MFPGSVLCHAQHPKKIAMLGHMVEELQNTKPKTKIVLQTDPEKENTMATSEQLSQ